MNEKLMRLYNTLAMVETKGQNTKIMAQCLQYLEQLMQENATPAEMTQEA